MDEGPLSQLQACGRMDPGIGYNVEARRKLPFQGTNSAFKLEKLTRRLKPAGDPGHGIMA
jgi:hypothetical protein